MAKRKFDPIPPGEILLEDFMKPLDISINALARAIDVPPKHWGTNTLQLFLRLRWLVGDQSVVALCLPFVHKLNQTPPSQKTPVSHQINKAHQKAKHKSWRAFSDINASKCPPVPGFPFH